jgi:hypothetical protein
MEKLCKIDISIFYLNFGKVVVPSCSKVQNESYCTKNLVRKETYLFYKNYSYNALDNTSL